MAASACSARSTPSVLTSTATLQVESTSLYQTAVQALHDKSTLAQVKALSLSDVYSMIEPQLTDAAVEIDGLTVTNLHQKFVAGRSDFLALGSSFRNLGELWQAGGVDASSLTYAQFKQNMDTAVKSLNTEAARSTGGASLALDGPPYVPVHNAECDPQHKSISKWYSGVSLSSVACAVGAAKNNGAESVSAVTGIKPHVGSLAVALFAACVGQMPQYAVAPLMQAADVGGIVIRRPAVVAGYGGLSPTYFDDCFEVDPNYLSEAPTAPLIFQNSNSTQ